MSFEAEPQIEGLVIRPIGETNSAITKLPEIGNVVVRACEVFDGVKQEHGVEQATVFCRESCPMRLFTVTSYRQRNEIDCPEKNTLDAYTRIGIAPQEALTVAVTDNAVGFSDELDKYASEGKASINPEGWQDVKGFNAFFVNASSGIRAIGRRLADCGDVNIEFKTVKGETIFGFMHLTRPNQTVGRSKYKFDSESQPVSYFEYALKLGLEHFGDVDQDSIKIVLRTAITEDKFIKKFSSDEQMEGHLPGWLEDGFLRNVTNPDWRLGDGHSPEDIWYADFKGIILRDIHDTIAKLGLEFEQFDSTNMLETMENPNHSSYERATREGLIDTRDLYVTYLANTFSR